MSFNYGHIKKKKKKKNGWTTFFSLVLNSHFFIHIVCLFFIQNNFLVLYIHFTIFLYCKVYSIATQLSLTLILTLNSFWFVCFKA